MRPTWAHVTKRATERSSACARGVGGGGTYPQALARAIDARALRYAATALTIEESFFAR